MDRATLVSVDEYLNTSFTDGDREYVDGHIVERNLGEIDHGDIQTASAYSIRRRYPNYWAAVEIRTRVSATRFRIPDVTIVAGPKPEGRVITSPPLVVVEVLSPDDRAGDMQEKIDDYLTFGIPCVWVVNPKTRRGYIHTPSGSRECSDGILRSSDGSIEVPLSELFG
jgi:Uma2 family endonuclease